MAKFSCLGIPGALFLLGADVSSMGDKNMIRMVNMDLSNSGSSNFGSSMSVDQFVDEGGGSITKGKFAGKWLKWIWGIVIFLVLLSALGILGILLRHNSSNTQPTASGRKASNTRPTASDVDTSETQPTASGGVSDRNFPMSDSDWKKFTRSTTAPTTTSATRCKAGVAKVGGHLDPTVEQQMERFVSSERESLAQFIWSAKKNLLKHMLNFWTPPGDNENNDDGHNDDSHNDGLKEEDRLLAHQWLEISIQKKLTLAAGLVEKKFRNIANSLKADANKWVCMVETRVESPKKLPMDGWVRAGSEALEEFNNDIDEQIEKKRQKLVDANGQLLHEARTRKIYNLLMTEWNDGTIDDIGRIICELTTLENKKAEAPPFVAEAIQRELRNTYPNLSEGSIKGNIRMPSIEELVEKTKVEEWTNTAAKEKIERTLVGPIRNLLDDAKVTKKQEKRIEKKWKDGTFVHLKRIIAKLTELENQKEQNN